MGYNNFLPLQMGEVVQYDNSLFLLSASASLRFNRFFDVYRLNQQHPFIKAGKVWPGREK